MGRGSGLLFITLKKYSVMTILSVCMLGQLDVLEGYFPTTGEWGLFVCCAACTSVFTPFVSFNLPHSAFFSGIFSFWSSKMRLFFFFFLQRMQYKLFLFICGASKHLNISSIFPWIVRNCQAPGKLVVFGWTHFSPRSKFSVAHWLNRLVISCPFDGFKA